MPVMVHPKLPGREITVALDRAVPTYERSGWQIKDDKPKRAKKTAEPEVAGERVEPAE